MSREPCPSRCTLLVEPVIVSISPVPKVPWPVLYFHIERSTPFAAGPLKSSIQTRDHLPPPCTGGDPAAAVAAKGVALAAVGNRATATAARNRIVRANRGRFMASPPARIQPVDVSRR